MDNRWAIRLVLVCFCLSSCKVPGVELFTNTKTPTIYIETESPTATIKVETAIPTQTSQVNTPKPPPTSDVPLIPTSTPLPDVWYIIQPGTPWATFNTVHEDAGCFWLGVGGQVFSLDGAPILGVKILAGGTLDGYPVGGFDTTGMETNIGEAGMI